MKKIFKIVSIIVAAVAVIMVIVTAIAMLSILKQIKDEENNVTETAGEISEVESQIQEQPRDEDKEQEFCSVLENPESEEGIEKLEGLAEYGYADAQFILGELYFQGKTVEKDDEKASNFLKMALDNGNINAGSLYGRLCFLGDGASQDYEESFDIFKSMAKYDPQAAALTGIMYLYGMGTAIDYNMSGVYLKYASDNGFSQAGDFINILKTLNVNIDDISTDAVASEKTKYIFYGYSGDEKLEKLISDYEEELLSTENYEEFDNELEALKTMNVGTAANVTVFGKDNWLFFQSLSDGDAYHDYVGDNAFTSDELKTIADSLKKRKKKVEDSGADFVVLIIPNKEIVYSEKMPTYIERVSEVSRTDKLVEYLEENTDVDVIYMKDTYLEYKDDYPIYYSTDTHYNMVGSFVALSKLMSEKYDKDIPLNMSQFVIHMDTYCGDLATMLGREDRYSTEKVYYLPEQSVPEKDRLDKSIMILGDSFSEFLNLEAQIYFQKGVSHLMVKDYGNDYDNALADGLSKNSTDLVVFEIAERYIDRLK